MAKPAPTYRPRPGDYVACPAQSFVGVVVDVVNCGFADWFVTAVHGSRTVRGFAYHFEPATVPSGGNVVPLRAR